MVSCGKSITKSVWIVACGHKPHGHNITSTGTGFEPFHTQPQAPSQSLGKIEDSLWIHYEFCDKSDPAIWVLRESSVNGGGAFTPAWSGTCQILSTIHSWFTLSGRWESAFTLSAVESHTSWGSIHTPIHIFWWGCLKLSAFHVVLSLLFPLSQMWLPNLLLLVAKPLHPLPHPKLPLRG